MQNVKSKIDPKSKRACETHEKALKTQNTNYTKLNIVVPLPNTYTCYSKLKSIEMLQKCVNFRLAVNYRLIVLLIMY